MKLSHTRYMATNTNPIACVWLSASGAFRCERENILTPNPIATAFTIKEGGEGRGEIKSMENVVNYGWQKKIKEFKKILSFSVDI